MDRAEGQGPTLVDHLVELRARLLRGVVGLVLVFAALLPFANRLYGWLAQPLLDKLPKGGQLIAVEVASPFFAPLKLAFFVALVAAMPWLLYQAWAFVAPGLYRRERRLALPLLGSALLLFYAGCAFAYFVVLPAVFSFLAKVTPPGVAMMTDINAYLDFVLVIFLAFGASFELPVALVILVLLGWVTPAQLREWRGYAVVGIFVVAAIITPPDVVSQLLLALPMVALYEAGILAAAALARSRPQA
jgi:sec-independent protein translocase protein TatC